MDTRKHENRDQIVSPQDIPLQARTKPSPEAENTLRSAEEQKISAATEDHLRLCYL